MPKDVADILGYANASKAIIDHCKAAVTDGITIRDSIGREQGATIIPERDAYRLVMRSIIPAAEQFEEWVVSDSEYLYRIPEVRYGQDRMSHHHAWSGISHDLG